VAKTAKTTLDRIGCRVSGVQWRCCRYTHCAESEEFAAERSEEDVARIAHIVDLVDGQYVSPGVALEFGGVSVPLDVAS